MFKAVEKTKVYQAAEFIQASGLWYSTTDLATALGISKEKAGGHLGRIRNDARFETLVQNGVPMKTKVVSIDPNAAQTKADTEFNDISCNSGLWNLAIFGT